MGVLGVLMAREFLDWVWWYNWEDDEDEENPAPLLGVTWAIWQKLQKGWQWTWARTLWPPWYRIMRIWYRLFPPGPFEEPVDEDGRTPTEWLAIRVLGIWNLECWYKDEYDWEVKRKWDECLRSRDLAENPGPEQIVSSEQV